MGMTNKEKFKVIFGIDVEDIEEINWNVLYRKQKKYCVEMYDSYQSSTEEIIQVIATSKADARKKAIDKLGSKYHRYIGSGKPMYALKVEEVVEDGKID